MILKLLSKICKKIKEVRASLIGGTGINFFKFKCKTCGLSVVDEDPGPVCTKCSRGNCSWEKYDISLQKLKKK